MKKLGGNIIFLDNVIQIQYYLPILSRLHNALLGRNAFLETGTNHPVIPIIFWVGNLSVFFGPFCLSKFDNPLLRRSSSILDKTESGNGYFFSCSSFNVGRLLPIYLENSPFLFSYLGFSEIETDSSIETVMDSLFEDFEDLGFFLNSLLLFLVAEEEEDLPQQLVIVISLSQVFATNSCKVVGLLICKMWSKSHSMS